MAANSAVVDYETENLEPPILSVEDAFERSSFFEVPPIVYPKHVGDISKGMAEADHKIVSAEVHQNLFISLLCFPSYLISCLCAPLFPVQCGSLLLNN